MGMVNREGWRNHNEELFWKFQVTANMEPQELLLHGQSCNLMFRLNSLHCALGRQCGLEVTEEGWEPQVSPWDSILNELLTA